MIGIRNSKKLYWSLIVAFTTLYLFVGFVSTLHSITFFQLANVTWMAVLLGITYELGQATVLFAILTSNNKQKLLPWSLMILLTALQVTANVYASFKFIDSGAGIDWTYWQRSILFWVNVEGDETFKIIISWITGALLPIVALGMTALVADNIKMQEELEGDNTLNSKSSDADIILEDDLEDDTNSQNTQDDSIKADTIRKADSGNEDKSKLDSAPVTDLPIDRPTYEDKPNDIKVEAREEIVEDREESKENEKKSKKPLKKSKPKETSQKPVDKKRGWNLKKEYIDSNGDVYSYGKLVKSDKDRDNTQPETESPKKV